MSPPQIITVIIITTTTTTTTMIMIIIIIIKLKKIDTKTRKLLNMHKMLHPMWKGCTSQEKMEVGA